MFPDQLKREGIVIEVAAIPIHAVMADKAIRPEGEGMSLGEGNVHLTVTGPAGVGSEYGYILRVTIRAGKRFLLRCELVTGQCVSQRLMREHIIPQICERGCRAAMLKVTITAG